MEEPTTASRLLPMSLSPLFSFIGYEADSTYSSFARHHHDAPITNNYLGLTSAVQLRPKSREDGHLV
jgi:hypothetical protein